MRDDDKYEIKVAFDLLPHVVGCSWTMTWFRLNKIKKPTREEFRDKVTEYFKILEPILEAYPNLEEFSDIKKYTKRRFDDEIENIKSGENKEVEKRYDRYLDYG